MNSFPSETLRKNPVCNTGSKQTSSSDVHINIVYKYYRSFVGKKFLSPKTIYIIIAYIYLQYMRDKSVVQL